MTLGNCRLKLVGSNEMGSTTAEPGNEVGIAGMTTVVSPKERNVEEI